MYRIGRYSLHVSPFIAKHIIDRLIATKNRSSFFLGNYKPYANIQFRWTIIKNRILILITRLRTQVSLVISYET